MPRNVVPMEANPFALAAEATQKETIVNVANSASTENQTRFQETLAFLVVVELKVLLVAVLEMIRSLER